MVEPQGSTGAIKSNRRKGIHKDAKSIYQDGGGGGVFPNPISLQPTVSTTVENPPPFSYASIYVYTHAHITPYRRGIAFSPAFHFPPICKETQTARFPRVTRVLFTIDTTRSKRMRWWPWGWRETHTLPRAAGRAGKENEAPPREEGAMAKAGEQGGDRIKRAAHPHPTGPPLLAPRTSGQRRRTGASSRSVPPSAWRRCWGGARAGRPKAPSGMQPTEPGMLPTSRCCCSSCSSPARRSRTCSLCHITPPPVPISLTSRCPPPLHLSWAPSGLLPSSSSSCPVPGAFPCPEHG